MCREEIYRKLIIEYKSLCVSIQDYTMASHLRSIEKKFFQYSMPKPLESRLIVSKEYEGFDESKLINEMMLIPLYTNSDNSNHILSDFKSKVRDLRLSDILD